MYMLGWLRFMVALLILVVAVQQMVFVALKLRARPKCHSVVSGQNLLMSGAEQRSHHVFENYTGIWRHQLEQQLAIYRQTLTLSKDRLGKSDLPLLIDTTWPGDSAANKSGLEWLPLHVCVVILTGYPAVAERKPHVSRILHQVLHALPLPHPDMSLKVKVFCEGNCSALAGLYPQATYYHLYPSIAEQPKHYYRVRKIAENYRLMFEAMFVQGSEEKCVILEDDLVLAPDALILLSHGHALMDADPTIFTVSLFNDNSFPSFSHNSSTFRRVSHFSGLGFLMSRNMHKNVIVPAWNFREAWDTILQKAMEKAKLCSVAPEVTRSCHARNANLRYGEPILTPKDPFQSAIVNKDISPKYNFWQLTQEKYDLKIRHIAYHGRSIEHVEDACFEDGATDLVYWKCLRQSKHLNDLLTKHHLWGMGNGNMVRGVYKGVLFLPICTSQVLIVCANSPFYQANLVNKHRQSLSAFHHDSSVPAAAAGIVYHLHSFFHLSLSHRGESCEAACARGAGECAVEGLWLLNHDCLVLNHTSPAKCMACKAYLSKKQPYKGEMPALAADGQCSIGRPYYLTCQGESRASRRICACKHAHRSTHYH